MINMLLIIISSAISIGAVAAFSGPVLANYKIVGGKIPTMFELMFDKKIYSNVYGMEHLLHVEYGPLKIMFILQMIIEGVALIGIFMSIGYFLKKVNAVATLFHAIVAILLNLAALILSLNTISLTKYAGTTATLGTGPISYCIILSIAIVPLLIVMTLSIIELIKFARIKVPMPATVNNPPSEPAMEDNLVKFKKSKQEIDNIKTALDIKLEAGIISKEEYDKELSKYF